jgi:DNA-binding NtrC family response regulator
MMNAGDETSAQATTALLVEDDAPMSWRLQDALTKAGYRVRAAGMLADARAALAEGAPKEGCRKVVESHGG